MTTPRRSARGEDGAMALVVSLLSVALFVVAALVVDLGLARDTKRQAQNAADAAALAAANALYETTTTPSFGQAVAKGKVNAEKNFGVTDADWAACTDSGALRYRPPSAPACISFQNSTNPLLDVSKPDTVRVLLPRRTLQTTLGRLSGVTQMSINAHAHASLDLNTRAPCALCILGDLRPSAHVVQNGDITTSGGNIHFNGDVSISSGGGLRAESSRAVTIQGQLINGGGTVTGTLLQNQPKMTDPLATTTLPNPLSVQNKTGKNPCDLPPFGGPGRYGAHTFNGSTCALAPGLYVIAGEGNTWSANGGVTITGTGVTLYFTCGDPGTPKACLPGDSGATLDASGSAIWTLKAPISGPLQGQLLVHDRNSASEMRLKGNSGGDLSGTIYAARGTLAFNGASCVSAIDSLIVAYSIRFAGNPACLKSHYNDPSNVPLPPAGMHLSR